MEHKHILVVDDESQITRVLRTSLSSHGHDIRVASDGETALEIMKDWSPDLVITDLAMPNMDGLELCRRLRTRTQIPIIVLSVRGEERTKVNALDAGADDYVTKPFSSRELVARMRAVLRRRGDSEEPSTSVLESGPVRMDVERHVVMVRNNAVHLPLKEFELLEVLLRNSGRVLTRMQLIDRVWGADYVGDTKTLDVHIKRLRAKVEDDPARPMHIITVRGLGYKFEPGT